MHSLRPPGYLYDSRSCRWLGCVDFDCESKFAAGRPVGRETDAHRVQLELAHASDQIEAGGVHADVCVSLIWGDERLPQRLRSSQHRYLPSGDGGCVERKMFWFLLWISQRCKNLGLGSSLRKAK